MKILNRQPVVLDGEGIAIVAQIVQLIINCFEAKPHVQKDRNQKMFVRHMINQNAKTVTLPKSNYILLDKIPESVPDFIKVHQSKKVKPDLDDMLYRYVKQMVCDHTIYVLCTEVSGDCTYVYNLSVTNSVADFTPEKKGKIIGVMVIETRLEVTKVKNNCLIHYMCILPKSQHKGYRRYFMIKVFKYDAQLNGRVYAVTRLIHDYILYSYDKPESEYSDSALYNQIQMNMVDAKEVKLRKPIFCKYINQIKE